MRLVVFHSSGLKYSLLKVHGEVGGLNSVFFSVLSLAVASEV